MICDHVSFFLLLLEHDHISEVLGEMEKLLEAVPFDDKTRETMSDSYNSIANYLKITKYEMGVSLSKKEWMMTDIKDQLKSVAGEMSSVKSCGTILHKYWMKLYEAIIKATVNGICKEVKLMLVF